MKVRINDLGEPFEKAVAKADAVGEPLVVEDEQGQERYSIYRLRKPSDEQKLQAQAGLEKIWQQTDRAMQESGVSEADIDRDLEEGD